MRQRHDEDPVTDHDKLTALEVAEMTGASPNEIGCDGHTKDARLCKLSRGHRGPHKAYGDDEADDALREETRALAAEVGPELEDCAGCKRGGRCAIHGAAKKRKSAAPTEAEAEPERAPAPPGRFDAAIPRTEIRRSPFNHRTFFAGLNELADSIRAHGILNPLIVRPAPIALQTGKKSGKVDPAKYELVAGERRWRAAGLAELELVPCIVRELSDVEVLEIQLIENVQRADVHPLEEATGYRDLMEHHGYTADTIAKKTGKSKAYVYARLKLCELPPVAREALASDRLSASIALLIARIPSERHQVWATREVLRLHPDDLTDEEREAEEADDAGKAHLDRLEQVEMDGPRIGGQNPHSRGAHDVDDKTDHKALPMSVREAQAHLQRNYMTRLELAKFALDDAALVPEVGACTKCVYRTGNQPELFGDVKRADVCTNPPCFDRKNRAAFAQLASELDESIKVLDQEQAKEARVFSHYDGTSVTGNSPYVEPDEPVPWTLLPTNQHDKRPTWEKLLGKKGLARVERVVAQDGTGSARQLITQADAVRLLREEGKLPKPEKKSSSGTARGGQDWAAQEEKRKAKAEITARAVLKAVQGVTVDARNMVKALRVVARQLGELAETGDGHEMIAALAGGGDQKPKRGGGRKYVTAGLVEKAADIYDLAELALRFALVDVAGPRYGGGIQPEGVAALKELGVDWSKVYDAEVVAAKAAEKAKKAEEKSKAPATGKAKKGASKR